MSTAAKSIERITKIENLLLIQNLEIDTASLREECTFGVPDLLRPLCWRLFLNYLPKERQSWAKILHQRREEYTQLVDNLIATHVNSENESESAETSDHPLSDETQSQWFKYFKDNEVLIQIHKDVKRLRPEIDFFQRYTNFPLQSNASTALTKRINACDSDSTTTQKSKHRNIVLIDTNQTTNDEFHWQIVERILFVYSKVNPGIKYVQGMNEIIAPIYYVLASSSDIEWSKYAEADCFFCFQNIMSEIKDNFIHLLDSSNCGIESMLTNFQQRLEVVDSELYSHLTKLDIKPQFFAFRWLSLLLAQEFSLPDLIALWDWVFASMNRMETTEYICLSMLCYIRNDLLNSDFAECMRILQNYPSNVDVSNLIGSALDLKTGIFERSRSGSTSSSKNSGRFWKTERFSTFMNNAKNQLNQLSTNARQYMHATSKSEGSISYRP